MTAQHLTAPEQVIVGVAMMDATEAREYVKLMRWDLEAADQALTNFRARALDFADRQGWKALGYGGALEAIQVELGEQHSKSYLSRILKAGEIERVLDLPIGQLPERVLRPLAQLDTAEEQREAWKQAAADGKPTAKQVQVAVEEAIGHRTPEDLIAAGVEMRRHGAWFTAVGYRGLMRGWVSGAAAPFERIVEQARTEIAHRTPPAAAPSEVTSDAGATRWGDWFWAQQTEGGTAHQWRSVNDAYWEARCGRSASKQPPFRIIGAQCAACLTEIAAREKPNIPEHTPPAASPQVASAAAVLDDHETRAQIRAQAAALGLGVIWENDTVIIHWPEEDIDQLLGMSYTDALHWLSTEGARQAEERAALIVGQRTDPNKADPKEPPAARPTSPKVTAPALVAIPPRPRRPVSADVSMQMHYINQLEDYASALETYIMALQRQMNMEAT